jgi:hypothetical protein
MLAFVGTDPEDLAGLPAPLVQSEEVIHSPPSAPIDPELLLIS